MCTPLNSKYTVFLSLLSGFLCLAHPLKWEVMQMPYLGSVLCSIEVNSELLANMLSEPWVLLPDVKKAWQLNESKAEMEFREGGKERPPTQGLGEEDCLSKAR